MDSSPGLLTMLALAGEVIESQKRTIDQLANENAALRSQLDEARP